MHQAGDESRLRTSVLYVPINTHAVLRDSHHPPTIHAHTTALAKLTPPETRRRRTGPLTIFGSTQS